MGWENILKVSRENMSPEDKIKNKIEGLQILYDKYKPHILKFKEALDPIHWAENWDEDMEILETALNNNDLKDAFDTIVWFSHTVDDAFDSLRSISDNSGKHRRIFNSIDRPDNITGFRLEVDLAHSLWKQHPDW